MENKNNQLFYIDMCASKLLSTFKLAYRANSQIKSSNSCNLNFKRWRLSNVFTSWIMTSKRIKDIFSVHDVYQ